MLLKKDTYSSANTNTEIYNGMHKQFTYGESTERTNAETNWHRGGETCQWKQMY